MSDEPADLIVAMAVEMAELRRQLAEAQVRIIETAIDAEHLHARVEALQAELVEVRTERDAWRAEAERRQVG